MKNVLLISGGGGSEHDISITSSAFIRRQIEDLKIYHPIQIHIEKDGSWIHESDVAVELNPLGELLIFKDRARSGISEVVNIDYVIPYMHGYPGETGHIQSYLELSALPYLGCKPEAHHLCFNKATAKLWFDYLNIPNTPYCIIPNDSKEYQEIAQQFFQENPTGVFVKASSQGSSVGCYKVEDQAELWPSIQKAFEFSDQVLVEKKLKGRELEVSAFEFQGKLHISEPGEILCPSEFYSYEEKYNEQSQTKTLLKAQDISPAFLEEIQSISRKAFTALNLRHLSRIDFFLTNDGKLYLNEINTLPGLTPISMFPQMMEAYGVKFSDYLSDLLG